MREVLQSVDGFRLQGRPAAANLKPNHSANEPEICTEVHSALLKSQRQLPPSVAPRRSDGELATVSPFIHRK